MTWRKTGSEFDDECANVELSDAAYRTHMEAIGFIYTVEAMPCTFAKSKIRRFASSDETTAAIKELVAHGFWRDLGDRFEVVHHADVIRQSLAAQAKKRDRDKRSQQAHRERQIKAEEGGSVSADVSAYVIPDADRQTDKQLRAGRIQTCEHGVTNGDQREVWGERKGQLLCHQCDRARRSA